MVCSGVERNIIRYTDTIFRLHNRNKTSWMHPRSKHWHLIDNVIVIEKDRQDVRVAKAMFGAECWTDHRLIMSKLNISIQPKARQQGKEFNKRLNVTKLERPLVYKKLRNDLDSNLESLPVH